MNSNKVLNNSFFVHSAFHCFYGLTAVKSSIRIGRCDDETLAHDDVSRIRVKDAVRKAPADGEVVAGGTREELSCVDGEVDNHRFLFR